MLSTGLFSLLNWLVVLFVLDYELSLSNNQGSNFCNGHAQLLITVTRETKQHNTVASSFEFSKHLFGIVFGNDSPLNGSKCQWIGRCNIQRRFFNRLVNNLNGLHGLAEQTKTSTPS